jgi:hypothetical protein
LAIAVLSDRFLFNFDVAKLIFKYFSLGSSFLVATESGCGFGFSSLTGAVPQ